VKAGHTGRRTLKVLISDVQTELCYQIADNSLQSIRLGLLRQYQCHASVFLYCRFQRHSHFSPRFHCPWILPHYLSLVLQKSSTRASIRSPEMKRPCSDAEQGPLTPFHDLLWQNNRIDHVNDPVAAEDVRL